MLPGDRLESGGDRPMFGNGEIPVLFTAGVEFEKSSQIFPDKAPRCDNVLWKWVSYPVTKVPTQ